jgi:hypothetical protein
MVIATAVLFLAALVDVHGGDMPRGVIKGRVTDAASGEAVPFQNVTLVGTSYGASTDADGRFVLRGIPDGKYELRVTGVGYTAASMTVELRPRGASGDVSVQLKEKEVPLAEVQIVVAAEKTADMPLSAQTILPHALSTLAGGMDDVARALSTLPGVAPMRLERNDLIVRGGAPFENLFVVDNIEFPSISHFTVQGAGTSSSSLINTDFIERVSFSSGGFGARSGDKLSSVVSLSLRDGSRDSRHASLTLSATQFGVSAEGPLSSTGSYIVSVRRSYLEPVFKAYDMSFAPVYWDGFVKADMRLGGSDNLRIIAVGTRDWMQLFNDTESKRTANEDLVFADQDMLITGVTWEHYKERWLTRLTMSNSAGSFSYYQPATKGRGVSTINSDENEMSAAFDASVLLTRTTEVSAGARMKFIRFRERVDLEVVPWFLNVNQMLARILMNADTSGMKPSAYLQMSQTIGSVVVNAGVRADRFTLIGPSIVVAPRTSVIWHLSEAWEATLSAGRYYQSPANAWLVNPYNMRLKMAGANQLIASASRTIGPDWKLSLEGYRKSYFDYPVSIQAPCMTVFNSGSPGSNFKDFGLDSLTSKGSGISRGMELCLERMISDAPLSGMVSLSWSETKFTALDGVERPADHDQRWIINAVLDGRFDKQWEITARFRLFTGHPYTDRVILETGTLEQYASEYNKLRVGVNHSLDLRIVRRWETASAQIEVFLDIQNVYNKKPLDTPEIDLKTGVYTETAMVGIVPSAGITIRL